METPQTSVAPLRLFLALWPGTQDLAELEAQAAAWTWPAGARRTRPERLHITLHFLGNVAQDRLPALREQLDVRWEGCELVLDRAQVWPGGIAVLEAQRVPAELASLHARVARRLRELDLPVEERRYRPHVTFARKAFGARPPAELAPVRWRLVPAFELVRSLPDGRGYERLQRFG